MAVMRPRRGLRVILNTECRQFFVLQTLNRFVVQVDMRHLDIGREPFGIHRKTMVLCRDFHLPCRQVHHRLVSPMMTEFQFERFSPQREPHDLMPKADSEHRLFSQKLSDIFNGIGANRRIPGAIG